MSAEPKPLTVEDAKKLLDFFDPRELAQLMERSRATHHGGPDTRERFHRDPSTGIYTPEDESIPLLPHGHTFEPLPVWFDEWAETDFYVPDRLDPRTFRPTPDIGPVVLMDWQKVILRFMFDRFRPLDEWFQNVIISTLKKAGKSMLAAAIGRWIAETWGNYSEVVCLGSDLSQAEDKLYAAITKSIELSPSYDANLQVLFALMVHPEDPDPANPTIFAPDYASPRWRLRSDGATHIPNHGTVKAVPRVYKKLAGGNQTAAIFTEAWTWTDTTARRLVDEMTPPPTRPRAIRLFEGYAGYEGESGLWEELWDNARNPKKGARMVTREELEPYGGWPFPPAPGAFKENPYPEHRDSDDPIPLYINPSLSIVALIDQGEVARRMPWQTPAYYESQRLDESYDRHHMNVPSAHKDEFVPKHWWDACNIQNHHGYTRRTDSSTHLPLPPVHESLRTIPPLTPNEACVIGLDASIDGDCTALVVVSCATWWEYLERDPSPSHFTDTYLRQHPEQERKRRRAYNEDHVMVREFKLWEPTKAHPMNYTTMVKPEILRYYGYRLDPNLPEDSDTYVTEGDEYDIKEIVYDQYQLHDLLVNLRSDYGIWIKPFSQSTGRDIADKDFYDSIRDRRFYHDGDQKLDEHRAGAAKRVPKRATSSTENRLHIVKKSNAVKVDLLVAISMASFEMRRMSG